MSEVTATSAVAAVPDAPGAPPGRRNLIFAMAAGWAFVRHSQRARAPFVPFRLLRGRGFGARVFVVFAALLIALLPVVWWLVPDHHGNW